MLEMYLEIMNAEEGRKILKPIFLFFLPSIHLANGSVLYDCHIFPSVILFVFSLRNE